MIRFAFQKDLSGCCGQKGLVTTAIIQSLDFKGLNQGHGRGMRMNLRDIKKEDSVGLYHLFECVGEGNAGSGTTPKFRLGQPGG